MRCAGLGLWLLLACAPLWAQVQTLTQATVTTVVNGRSDTRRADLPYHWDKHHQGQRGEAVFELAFDMPAFDQTGLRALLVPKLGNAFVIELNGMLLVQQGDMTRYNGADHSLSPHHVLLPAQWLQERNRLKVHIRADIGRRGGLGFLVVGPADEVYSLYTSYHNSIVLATVGVSMFSLVVGVIALSLWGTQVDRSVPGRRQRDSLYLYAGLAEVVWAIGLGYVLIERPPLAWPWWGMVSILALGIWCCSMSLFCIEVVGWGQRPLARRFRSGLLVLLALCPLAVYLAIGQGHAWVLTGWYLAMGLAFMGFALVFSAAVWRPGSPWPHRAVALVIWLNLAMGLRDIYLFRIDPQYPQITWLRFTSVLFGITLIYIVLSRFRRVSEQAHVLLQTMASRVQQREQELQASYQKLEQMAREQERSAERARILRDMHDGVGSHLSSAIRQVEGGRSDARQLLATLRDSLDQLKMSIDAMSLPAGDVGGLLANLRYRLASRFEASGIRVDWQVQALPELHRLDTQAMRHLQFIIFEAFSNILQHAHCTVMGVSAQAMPDGIEVVISDNGRGFDVQQTRGNGLHGMQERASAIGAVLAWRRASGRTSVSIWLPAGREPPPLSL